jgi:hypothetical protein
MLLDLIKPDARLLLLQRSCELAILSLMLNSVRTLASLVRTLERMESEKLTD